MPPKEKTKYERRFAYLGISENGTYGHCLPEVTSYGTSTSSCEMRDSRLTPYYGEMTEGATVVDKRPCVKWDDFVKCIISGPMVNVELPDGTCNRFRDFGASTVEPCSDFGASTVEPCSDAGALRSLDYVALDVYAAWWASMGARVGRRVGKCIRWSDGTRTLIPPFKYQWKHEDGTVRTAEEERGDMIVRRAK